MNWRERLIWLGPVLSGLLITATFAPFEMANAAWCALVPLLISCAYVKPSSAWKLGWFTGMVFWLTVMWWLIRVTAVGWILLCAYISLYFIPIAMMSAWWFRKYGIGNFLRNWAYILLVTVLWIASEFTRINLFTGFPWNPLGASQYANIPLIQHASWGGVYAVSGLLVLANASIAVTLLRYLQKQTRLGRKPHPELMLGMAVIVIAFVTGGKILREVNVDGEEVRMALIQPSIAQYDKWTPEKVDSIYAQLRELTSGAVIWTKPDLVVWPETALPDELMYSERSYDLVDGLSRLGSPLLVGTMDAEYIADQRPIFYNSSYLINTNGMAIQKYDKRHLVLFGEYVPLHEHVRFITAMTPLAESFSPGQTSTVFQLPGKEVNFSSLICFEDALAYLGRASVKNGARLLINQTNDGWFDPSAASRQHMALAVFRAVENRVPMVRSANTGYTCAIDARGQIREMLTGENHRHDSSGFQLVTVHVPDQDMKYTFYTRHGDLLAWLCLLPGLGVWLMAWRDIRKPIFI